jgi:aryl-alcohol dehydrogenase-like predicted oxidoreductase
VAAAADPGRAVLPGTGSVAHLAENLTAEGMMLDDEALRDLDGNAG